MNSFIAKKNSANFISATEGFSFATGQNFIVDPVKNLPFGNNFSVLGWIYPNDAISAQSTIFVKKSNDSTYLIQCFVDDTNI